MFKGCNITDCLRCIGGKLLVSATSDPAYNMPIKMPGMTKQTKADLILSHLFSESRAYVIRLMNQPTEFSSEAPEGLFAK